MADVHVPRQVVAALADVLEVLAEDAERLQGQAVENLGDSGGGDERVLRGGAVAEALELREGGGRERERGRRRGERGGNRQMTGDLTVPAQYSSGEWRSRTKRLAPPWVMKKSVRAEW